MRMLNRRSFVMAGMFFAGVAASLLANSLASLLPSRHKLMRLGDNVLKPPLNTLWGGFLQPGVNCVVSFSNPVFLSTVISRNRIFLTYRGPQTALPGSPITITPGDPYVDPDLVKNGATFYSSEGWTGTGDLYGVYQLTSLFAGVGHPLKVIRSRKLTYADLRDSNVVFLGSPWANDMQDKINPGQTPLVCLGSGKITNFNPRDKEKTTYEREYDPYSKVGSGSTPGHVQLRL